MKYIVDIRDNDSMILGEITGDEKGILGISLRDAYDDEIAKFYLDEPQLEELLAAINLVKAVRPKKEINIPNVGGSIQYNPPPGVRTFTTNVEA